MGEVQEEVPPFEKKMYIQDSYKLLWTTESDLGFRESHKSQKSNGFAETENLGNSLASKVSRQRQSTHDKNRTVIWPTAGRPTRINTRDGITTSMHKRLQPLGSCHLNCNNGLRRPCLRNGQDIKISPTSTPLMYRPLFRGRLLQVRPIRIE